MPPSRSSLVCNHCVALAGTPARAAISTSRLPYVATRLGVVRAEGDRDLMSYMEERPGAERAHGLALFDQMGDVTLADARRALEASRGAVLCTVISVRREDAEALRLQTRQDWERFVRSRWQQAFASMANVPESRVRYVAAMHANQPNNLHVHVLSWDAGERQPWNSLLDKKRMEAARKDLTDAALEPELRRLARERTHARDEAVEIVRNTDLTRYRTAMPGDGSLKYAHLRRFHPEAAKVVAMAADEAVAGQRDAVEALRRHEAATRAMGELKGMSGRSLERYVEEAREDMGHRLRNAAVTAIVGDRSARPADERLAPRHERLNAERRQDLSDAREVASFRHEDEISPSRERREERALAEELEACLRPEERDEVLEAVAEGREPDVKALERCPSVTDAVRSGRVTARSLVSAFDRARSKREHDTGSSVAREVVRIALSELTRALLRNLRQPVELEREARDVAHDVERSVAKEVVR